MGVRNVNIKTNRSADNKHRVMKNQFERALEQKELGYNRLRNNPSGIFGRRATDAKGWILVATPKKQSNGRFRLAVEYENRQTGEGTTVIDKNEYDDYHETLLHAFDSIHRTNTRFERFERNSSGTITSAVFTRPMAVRTIDDAVRRFQGVR